VPKSSCSQAQGLNSPCTNLHLMIGSASFRGINTPKTVNSGTCRHLYRLYPIGPGKMASTNASRFMNSSDVEAAIAKVLFETRTPEDDKYWMEDSKNHVLLQNTFVDDCNAVFRTCFEQVQRLKQEKQEEEQTVCSESSKSSKKRRRCSVERKEECSPTLSPRSPELSLEGALAWTGCPEELARRLLAPIASVTTESVTCALVSNIHRSTSNASYVKTKALESSLVKAVTLVVMNGHLSPPEDDLFRFPRTKALIDAWGVMRVAHAMFEERI
jgi:hypothetical protein